MATNEYRPLNLFDTNVEENRSRSFGINRRALFTFLAVCGVVTLVVVVSVVLVVKNDSRTDSNGVKKRSDEKRYQFEDIFNGDFSPYMPNEVWSSDVSVLRLEDGNIVQYNVETKESSLLFYGKMLWRDNGVNFDSSLSNTLSPDGKWMLFPVEKRQKYRYSTVGKYIVINKETGKAVKIKISASQTMPEIQYISWGKKSNCLVFVSDNDVYWMPSVETPEKVVRVTSTGRDKIFFNGVPDWVYEEEILGQRPSLLISPDDKHLCYASFNDTEVPLFEIAIYGKPPTAYSRIQDIAYPKPGTKNPDVRIYVYNVENNGTIELDPPEDLKKSDYYFTNLVWADNDNISVTWMNRAQTTSVVMLCNAARGTCIENYRLVSANGWVNQNYYDPFFSSDGTFYIQLLPHNEGPKTGDYLHIAKVPSIVNANKYVKYLTEGQWDVKKIVSFDRKNEIVYYESTEISPMKSHLYSVDLKGNKKCISCELKQTKDEHCSYYTASFSTESSWFFLTCAGPGVPMSWFYNSKDINTATVLQSNEKLAKKLVTTPLPTFVYHKIKTTDGAYDIWVREMRPPDFQVNRKYAVLFDVYGGPGSQKIEEMFKTGYHTYLTSNFDIIVCEVDGRGTASRGQNFKYSVYMQLGEYEKNDTLAAARFMQTKEYVDPNRISIWGWSYGGFLSSYILSTQESRVFQSAASVAPVTDWRLYDSIYTERYMGTPVDNRIGYDFSSVLKHANNIPDDSFLLIHGTGDDNVHFQNSAQLIEVLTQADIKFQMQIYTDKHHSLEGDNIQRHLYALLTDFFKEKLKL